jgi:hypothetical protein
MAVEPNNFHLDDDDEKNRASETPEDEIVLTTKNADRTRRPMSDIVRQYLDARPWIPHGQRKGAKPNPPPSHDDPESKKE